MIRFLAATLGGWAGWAMGSPLSLFAAMVLSGMGMGLGLWAAARLIQEYF
jgi:hypothetical protein